MNDHIIHLVHDPLFIDARRSGNAGEHAETAARCQRHGGIHLVDEVADP